jgi:hypothetical protein
MDVSGSASGNRTRISALKGPRANRCTIAPLCRAEARVRAFNRSTLSGRNQRLEDERMNEAEHRRASIAVGFFVFFVPSHLDRFEFAFA